MITYNTNHIKFKDSGSLDIFSNGTRIWGLSSGSLPQMYIGSKAQDNYIQTSGSAVNIIVSGSTSTTFTSASLNCPELTTDNIFIHKVGGGLSIITGSNASMGTSQTSALSGNVTVATDVVKTSSKIFLTAKGTHIGRIWYDTIVNNTSFKINSTSSEAIDVDWLIININ